LQGPTGTLYRGESIRKKELAKRLAKLSNEQELQIVFGRTLWEQDIMLSLDKVASHGLALGISSMAKPHGQILKDSELFGGE